MKIMHDLYQENDKIILMIHPMLSSAEGFQKTIIPYLGESYHYLLPDLNGHGDSVDATYITAEEEAKDIHDYLLCHNYRKIHLGYCASLGGCVMFYLLRYEDISFEHLFFEGISMYKNAPALNIIVRSVYLFLHRMTVKYPAKMSRIIAKKYGEIAGEAMANRFVGINEESIRNICFDCSHVDVPSISEELQKWCIFAYGDGDFDLNNSRKLLPHYYPQATLVVWKGFGHCERISKDSKDYADDILKYI